MRPIFFVDTVRVQELKNVVTPHPAQPRASGDDLIAWHHAGVQVQEKMS